jgi:hypothetical protein
MINKVTITINDDTLNQLIKRRITKEFTFNYENIDYENCILYYGIGNVLLIKITGNLPIVCKLKDNNVSFLLGNQYLEAISV